MDIRERLDIEIAETIARIDVLNAEIETEVVILKRRLIWLTLLAAACVFSLFFYWSY